MTEKEEVVRLFAVPGLFLGLFFVMFFIVYASVVLG